MNTGLSWFDPVTHWMESLQLKIHYRHRKQQFDRMFANGDAFDTRGAYEQFKYSECLALLNIPPARFRRVLEIGCAEGAFTERLAPYTDELVAMDLAEPAVARARETLRPFSHVHVRLENIATANFDGPFDLVIASDVIYYLGQEHSEHHLDEMLARFAQWVQPGGRILIANGYKLNVPTDDWFHRRVMVGYRVTLERQGLRLLRERDLSGANVGSEATCLLSLLEKPDDGLSPRAGTVARWSGPADRLVAKDQRSFAETGPPPRPEASARSAGAVARGSAPQASARSAGANGEREGRTRS